MTQERFSWENCRSLPIEGSATLTIDASSTTTNWASASSANASHFRSGASVGLKVELSREVDRYPVQSRRCGAAAHRQFGASSGPPPLTCERRCLSGYRNWSSAFASNHTELTFRLSSP